MTPNETLAQDGFALFPGVLTSEEVSSLRAAVAAHFADWNRTAKRRIDPEAERIEAVRQLFGHQGVLDAARSILGDPWVLVDEIAAHDSHFAEPGGGWHTDTTSPEALGRTFHQDPAFKMVQGVIYLQDSTQYGGGLDIIPGSHRRPDPFVETRRAQLEATDGSGLAARARGTLVHRLAKLTSRPPKDPFEGHGFTIPSRAGDLVMFDLRATHRGTPWTVRPDSPDKRKLAVFFVAGANNEPTQQYREWLQFYTARIGAGLREPPAAFADELRTRNVVFIERSRDRQLAGQHSRLVGCPA